MPTDPTDPTRTVTERGERDLLAMMAATIAAGLFDVNPAGHGHHAHHDADRESVARVSVDIARRILERCEAG